MKWTVDKAVEITKCEKMPYARSPLSLEQCGYEGLARTNCPRSSQNVEKRKTRKMNELLKMIIMNHCSSSVLE